jgi:hypothetical protein
MALSRGHIDWFNLLQKDVVLRKAIKTQMCFGLYICVLYGVMQNIDAHANIFG